MAPKLMTMSSGDARLFAAMWGLQGFGAGSCWGCGAPAPPPGEKPFSKCGACVDKKYSVPASFCSPGCLKHHWPEHRKWHKEKEREIAAQKIATQISKTSRSVGEDDVCDAKSSAKYARELEAKDEYERLEAVADRELSGGDYKAAVKLAKKAIKLEPDRPSAHVALANAYLASNDYLRASHSAAAAMERYPPDTQCWAGSARFAWATRRQAPTPCGSGDIFCDCDACAALPEKPEWMASPQALVAMAERVVAADSAEDANAWVMHGHAHEGLDWATAARSYTSAARLFGVNGDKEFQTLSQANAQRCRKACRSC